MVPHCLDTDPWLTEFHVPRSMDVFTVIWYLGFSLYYSGVILKCNMPLGNCCCGAVDQAVYVSILQFIPGLKRAAYTNTITYTLVLLYIWRRRTSTSTGNTTHANAKKYTWKIKREKRTLPFRDSKCLLTLYNYMNVLYQGTTLNTMITQQ